VGVLNLKRYIKSAWLIGIAVLFLLQAFDFVFAQGMKDETKIDMKVEVGYDGYYRLGNDAPFFIEIDNKLKDINGELQIEMPDDNDNVILYVTPVNLPNNSTKKFVINVPMGKYLSKMQINIAEGNNKIFTKAVKITPGLSMETLGIGILSDDYESIKYINKIPIGNYTQFTTKTVKLTESMLTENADILKNFNVLVINNFDTSKLTEGAYKAIKRWVADGGLLLLGTGPSYSKTLGIFKDDFISGQIGEVTSVATKLLYNVAQSSGALSMQLNALSMEFKNSETILAEGSTPLVVRLNKGKGAVAIAAFDFGLEPLSGWVGRAAFSEKLMQKLLPNYNNPNFTKDIYIMNNMYAIDNSLRSIPELPRTDTGELVIVLLIYIIMVAPVSYLILKKLDKREWMWVTVPVVSVIFAFIVYRVGFETRMNEPIVNVINMVEFETNGSAVSMSYAGVFTPNKTDLKIETTENTTLKPTMVIYNDRGPTLSEGKKEKTVIAKVLSSPNNRVEYYKNSIWSMRTMTLNDNISRSGSFDVKVNRSNGAYQGSVTNHSGFDLQEGYIVTPNEVIPIGAIKNEETITLKDVKGTYYSYPYDMLNAFYKDPYANRKPGVRLTKEEMNELRKNQQKRQVMEFYFMGGQNIKGAKLVGWSNSTLAKDILVNGKVTKKYEKNLVAADVELTFRNGNKISYPYGYLQPTITSNNLTNGNYDEYGRSFNGKGEVELSFQIDKDIIPEYVRLQYSVSQGGPASLKEFMWNNVTNSWEEGSYTAFYIDKSRSERYIDKNNTIKMKFELYDGNVQLPQISVEGSVK
jgi:hypothetical protein